jgi:hypothetical protein
MYEHRLCQDEAADEQEDDGIGEGSKASPAGAMPRATARAGRSAVPGLAPSVIRDDDKSITAANRCLRGKCRHRPEQQNGEEQRAEQESGCLAPNG